MTDTASHDQAFDGALRLLDWYGAMGVDAALGDDAIDWLARATARPGADYVMPSRASAMAAPALSQGSSAPAPQSVPPAERRAAPRSVPTVAPRAFAGTPPDAAVLAARAQAPTAGTLEALADLLAAFDGCGLKATAKSLCFYRGAPKARLMVIGEAPGREDDLEGAPFRGPAGELLDKMLAAIGLTEAACHITNVVYWRPPGNRALTPQETDVCRPFLDRQVALVSPDVVLLLGAASAKTILANDDSIMRVRGKWHDLVLGGHAVRAIATLHPTYLLRTPGSKQQAWRDLLAVKAALA